MVWMSKTSIYSRRQSVTKIHKTKAEIPNFLNGLLKAAQTETHEAKSH